MKEKPIVFSTPMVHALLNTRAGVWPAEPIDSGKPFKWQTRRVVKPQPDTDKEGTINIKGFWIIPERDRNLDIFPYHVGDILWVRETWAGIDEGYVYRADGKKRELDLDGSIMWEVEKWRQSIFMPREASRILLEVKGVRIERVQDISEYDAWAEGIFSKYGHESVFHFMNLWDSINAKRGYSWESNPWVYVCEFMRVLG
jgi:hypothetical protein